MIPVNLTFKGVYSYYEEHSIDFSKLTEAHLFGIFGNTGSGKSTILECISFVLYGKTERLNTHDGLLNNMMNLKSNVMFIDYIFLSKDKIKYKFFVEYKRNKRNFDDIKLKSKNIYKFDNDDWSPVSDKVENIIGMSYENFKRTVIVPQGQFQEFLTLSPTNRTKMLKEIFHLQKYDMSKIIRNLSLKNNSELIEVDTVLNELKDVSTQTIKINEEKLSKLKNEKQKIENDLNLLLLNEKEMDNLKILFDDFSKNKIIFDELKKQENNYKTRKKTLKKYRIALETFKPVLDLITATAKEIDDRNINIEKLKNRLNKTQKKLLENKELFVKYEKDYLSIENIKNVNKDLDYLISIRENENNLKSIVVDITNKTKQIDNIKTKLNDSQNTFERTQNKVEEIEKNQPDMKHLYYMKDWFLNYKNKKNIHDKIIADIQKINADISKIIRDSKNQLFDEIITETDIIEQDSISVVSKKITAYKNKLSESNKILYDKEILLSTKKELSNFSDKLKSGQKCPLCGSLEHPEPIEFENVDEQLKNVSINKKENEKLFKKVDNILSLFNSNIKLLSDKEKSLQNLQIDLLASKEDLNNYVKNLSSDIYSIHDEEKLKNDIYNAEKIDKEKKILQDELKNLQKTRTQLQKIYDDNSKLLNSLVLKENSIKTTVETIKKQISTIIISDYSQYDEKEVLKLKSNNLKKIIDIEKNYNKVKSEIDNLNKDVITFETSLSETKKFVSELLQRQKSNETNFNELLAASDFSSSNQIKDVLNKKINVIKEEEEILSYNRNLFSSENKINELKSKMQDKTYDEKNYKDLKENIKVRSKELETLNKDLITTENLINELKNKIKRKNEYQEKEKNLITRKENLSILNNLFRGDGFVNYISKIYLHNLSLSANKRFYKLTNRQYSFELDENNSFIIRDFLNNGRSRNVKTLSGGQLFQISLCLALSLAEEIQKDSKTEQNFFFLDEGFGTLDKDSLRTVFTTLQTLKKENRIVGLISHVDEIQEEIEMNIRVSLDKERGSLMKFSWK